MSDLWLHDVRLVQPDDGIVPANILISQGRVARIGQPDDELPRGAFSIQGNGRLLTPGLIDLHTHGIGQFLYERSAADIEQAAGMLPRFGTTCVLPTLYRVMNRSSLKLLDELSAALGRVHSVRMPGFHLEGPFLALPGAGAETIPGDLALLEEVLSACRGRVIAMSVSPDTPNVLPVIERLVSKRIVPFITHTQASAEETRAAIEAGARHATHFYDVFPVPAESEPGVRPVGAVEAILADSRASVDFICDGVHVSPFAIRAALAAKTWQGVVMITDSNVGAGAPSGEYDTPWGFRIRIAPGDAARIATASHPYCGALAGSALTMDQGMRNLHRWLPELPSHQLWAMGTSNPARIAGLTGMGQLRVGSDADMVLWDDSLKAAMTWVGGNLVHGEPQ